MLSNIGSRRDDGGIQTRRVQRVLGVNAGRGRNDPGIQSRRSSRSVRRDTGSRRHDGIKPEPAAGLIASDVPRDTNGRGSDHVGRKTGSLEIRAQAFQWRWAGVRFEREQVGYCIRGGGKFKVGSVDDLRRERATASHVNGLGAVVRFAAAGAASGAGLCAAQIFGARQFVAGVVNHFIGLQLGHSVGAKLVDLPRDNDNNEQQKQLQQPRSQHAPVGENAVRSFPGQASAGAGKGGTDRSDELIPAWRPLDQ